jgi:prepilin peptidase CpaA
MAAVALAVGVDYLLVSLTVAFLSSLFMLLPFYLRAAGAGDVKMMFAAGLTSGPGNTLNLILLVSLAGLILAVVMLLTRRVNPARLKHYLRCLFDWRYDRAEGRKSIPPPDTEACRVPFGVAIAAGLWCNLLIQLLYMI